MTVTLKKHKHSPEPTPKDSGSSLDKSEAVRLSKEVMRIAVEQKALDVRGLDLESVSDIADCFVILSGNSQRHVQGITDKIKAYLREAGETPLTSTGQDNGDWVLLDYGNLVIHLFYEPTRQYYKIDELWKEAEEIPLPEELENQARKLRTGLYLTISNNS